MGPERNKNAFIVASETNAHGDTLCFTGKIWARHKTLKDVFLGSTLFCLSNKPPKAKKIMTQSHLK